MTLVTIIIVKIISYFKRTIHRILKDIQKNVIKKELPFKCRNIKAGGDNLVKIIDPVPWNIRNKETTDEPYWGKREMCTDDPHWEKSYIDNPAGW